MNCSDFASEFTADQDANPTYIWQKNGNSASGNGTKSVSGTDKGSDNNSSIDKPKTEQEFKLIVNQRHGKEYLLYVDTDSWVRVAEKGTLTNSGLNRR